VYFIALVGAQVGVASTMMRVILQTRALVPGGAQFLGLGTAPPHQPKKVQASTLASIRLTFVPFNLRSKQRSKNATAC
jgi:hypothetical protein